MKASLNLSKGTFLGIIGILLYKIILDIVYVKIIYPFYSYADFGYDFSIGKVITSYLFLFIISTYIVSLYKSKHIVLSYVVIFLTTLSFIPNLTLISFNNFPSEYIISWTIYWVLFYTACKILPYIKMKNNGSNTVNTLYLYLFVLSASVIFVSGVYSGFRIQLNILDVYDIRAESKEYNYPTIFSYIIPAAGTILPIILLYFLDIKKYIISVFIIFVIVLNFGIGGHKAVIFSLFITLLFYFYYRGYMIQLVSYFMCIMGIIGLVEYYCFHSFILISLFFRRLLFVPALLNTYYYEFFTLNSPDYFRQSFLRYFGFVSPYNDPIANIIGDQYVSAGCVANNGLFSDALLNLGVMGIFIFPILLVGVLKLLDSFSKGIPARFVVVPCLMMSLPLLSTTLMTALLTSGIFFVMYLFYVFPKSKIQ